MEYGRLDGKRVLAAAAASTLLLCAAALASGSTIPVTLKVVGSTDRDVGQSVKLTATAKLPRGDRLLIMGMRRGKPNVKVAECLRSPCTGTFRDRSAEVVAFQASVIKRTGSKTTTLGRSKKTSVSWSEPTPPEPPTPPAPPPPPPPPAAPGHYDGRTSQNEIFAFDVSADGTRITGLHTGQINQSCDPPDYYLSGGYLNNWSGSVQRDGSFTLGFNGPGTVGGNAATFKITIVGRFSTGTASGTIRDDVSWMQSGTAYNCSSGDQTWSATKTG
jgi:hypothetical protein